MDLRICGYANAYGGTLYIDKNDNGDVIGISDKDRKKLLEIIPNKITDTMGIVADVNLLYGDGYSILKLLWTSTLLSSAIMGNIFTVPAAL